MKMSAAKRGIIGGLLAVAGVVGATGMAAASPGSPSQVLIENKGDYTLTYKLIDDNGEVRRAEVPAGQQDQFEPVTGETIEFWIGDERLREYGPLDNATSVKCNTAGSAAAPEAACRDLNN